MLGKITQIPEKENSKVSFVHWFHSRCKRATKRSFF